MKKYSDWQKIDLHIHTDESKKTKHNDYKGIFAVDTLKSKLVENNVTIFSLTDHNIINTAAYAEYVQGFQPGDPFPLLGIELDVEHTNEKIYHALVIFKEDITKNSEFVEQISSKLEELYSGQEKYTRKTKFESIIDKFYQYEFIFILHGEGDKSIWEAIKNNSKDIKDTSDFVIGFENLGLEKVREETIENWNDGFDRVTSEGLSSEDYVPYMSFSDNHNIQKYPNKHTGDERHFFTYIKGLANYESLRLAFIDPTVRIKREDDVNTIKHNVEVRGYIDKIDIIDVKLDDTAKTKIEKTKITFSPYFNAIIGGRSTGKSLLMELLRQKIAGLQNYQEPKEKYKFSKKDIKIQSDKDQEWADVVNINTKNIAYLSQGQIIEYFQSRNMKDFAAQVGKTHEYDEVLERFKGKKTEILSVVDDLIKKYEECKKSKSDISSCKIQQKDIDYKTGKSWSFRNAEYVMPEDDKDQKIENIRVLKQQLAEFKSFWNLAKDELDLLNSFISLINIKYGILEAQKKLAGLKQSFIAKVSEIIKNSNTNASAKGLSKDAAQKELAQTRISNIPNKAYEVFSKFLALNKTLKQVKTTSLYHEESVNIDETISIGFSTNDQNKQTLDDLIRDNVFSGARQDNSSLYHIICHDHSINQTGSKGHSMTFENKLKNVVQLDSFESPVSFLIYKTLNNSKSTNNSPGLNCEYYLKTIFANPDITTIIIDQPEDNLGTTFISEKKGLVDTIRHEKLNKQIFLATHNASIVVYGDAENIILAENTKNSIKYTQILMEAGEDAMKTICENLDGGKRVFENRSRKYNIKKIREEKQ